VPLPVWAKSDIITFMVKIRLTQTGTTNRKTYRIIAIEEGKRRDGKAIENLGHFNPLVKPPNIVINRERIAYWQSKGAQVTPAVADLLKRE
jgi:small subunit ribosomal protein S16